MIILIMLVLVCTSTESNISRIVPSTSDLKNPLPVTKIQGFYLKDLAASIGVVLQDISNRELGVPVMQDIYDALEFVPVHDKVHKKLNYMSEKIVQKLNETFHFLNVTKKLVEENYEKILTENDLLSTVVPCFSIPPVYVSYPNKALKNNFSALNPDYLHYFLFSTNQNSFNLTQVFADHLQNVVPLYLGMKRIYFLSSYDAETAVAVNSSNCPFENPSLWREYLSTLRYGPKHVLILIDHGGNISSYNLEVAKTMAKSLLMLLDSNDRASVIGIANSYSVPNFDSKCSQSSSNESVFVPGTELSKERLYNFVDSLSSIQISTNHSLGFKKAFNIVTTYTQNPVNVQNFTLIYITQGSHFHVHAVFKRISSYNSNIPIQINSILIPEDSRNTPEKESLTDLVTLNFSKYNITSGYLPLRSGILEIVASKYNLGLVATRVYAQSKPEGWGKGFKVSNPHCDSLSKESIVSISIICGDTEPLGVLAVDLYLNNLVEDIMYPDFNSKYSYAFLVNLEGLVIVHKSLNQPHICLNHYDNVHIRLLEKAFDFDSVREKIASLEFAFFKNGTKVYTCKQILNWYIVCYVFFENESNTPKRLLRVALPQNADVIHNRLDLLPTQTVCRHLKQIASIESGVLYLSASCFASPFSQLRFNWESDLSTQTMEHYMAYLKDHTGLIANPGFKSDTRNEALSLLHMMSYLKVRHLSGSLRQYAVRRYVASAGGVLQVYPGTNIQPDLDPTRRVWYQRAIAHPGRVILSAPYLDAGGAGYIVTLSHTVYEGKKDSMHSSRDNVFAVMGIDLTIGYFYKLLLQKMPFCKQTNVKCFLMDDKGYLISHPSLMDPNGREPVEQIHIVNKESIVASDILNQKYFVKKILCNNFMDGTMQRYYQFNSSYESIVRNTIMIHGKHCSKYQISPILGTNLFVGVVNSSCENSATFCPCSMVDRLCFNCNRMEQNECECPCECPMNLQRESCPKNNKTFLNNPICSILDDHFRSNATHQQVYSKMSNIKACSNFHCELYTTEDSCMGIVGCEWCQIDLDGETPLDMPFCTSLTSCFNGVLGSITPYGDSYKGPITNADLLASTYSAIGPIVGSLVILFLILSLVIYFYRQHYTAITADELYLEGDGSAIPTLRGNHVEMDDINDEQRDDYRDRLMVYNLETVSPYRLSTGYRRPHTTGDSDHGYSTMTPHDESEHLSVALVEPSLATNGDQLSSNGSSLATECSSSGGPSHKSVAQTSETTVLPHKHCMLVPVTVHRIMETT